jgi:hypothetical protein
MRGLRLTVLLAGVVLGTTVMAQTLRFDSYHEPQPPEGANLRLGAFYSDLAFEQSVGYRYTRSSGAGGDYLYREDLGRVRKDGSDFPMVSRLSFRNYLIIGKYMDLDFSFDLRYSYFPMGTEDNEFAVEYSGPGFSAQMGSFSFGMTKDAWQGSYNGRQSSAYTGSEGSGFLANLSSDFQLTPFLRGRIYDNPSYRVDYVDDRGIRDPMSGRKYPVIQNVVGLDMDWLMAQDKNMAYSASRTDTIPQEDYFDAQRSVIYRQSLAYQQQLNPVAAGGARADYTWRDYQGRRGLQRQQDYLGFLSVDLTENTLVRTSLGYSMAELSDAGANETNGVSDSVIGAINVSSKLSDRATHSLGYSRSQRGGFTAGLEIVDALNYGLSWGNELWSVGFLSAYEIVETRLSGESNYRDWVNQLTASRALSPDLTMTLATAYSLRHNETLQDGAGSTGEEAVMLQNDYDTWASNIGLTYLLTEHLVAYTYVDHTVRTSDASDLKFTRDTAGVTLVYRYDF